MKFSIKKIMVYAKREWSVSLLAGVKKGDSSYYAKDAQMLEWVDKYFKTAIINNLKNN